jgi:F0F1-type ATP synthase assembly protein I
VLHEGRNVVPSSPRHWNLWRCFLRSKLHDERRPPKGDPEKDSPQRWLRYTNLGVEFALSFGVFVALGWWVGKHFEWNPWATLIGAALGFIGAMYNLIREGMKMAREVEAERREGHENRAR